ncbi:MAG: gephyrin-like molybdotransferase Glp [Variibacter sp.]
MALIPVEEALARVLDGARGLPEEFAPVAEAQGRVLTRDLKALRTQPPADVSAMDGYAVRSVDLAKLPADLKVIGEVPAGRMFDGTVSATEAVRILTGGLLPAGADTIVIQENARRDGDRVIVETPSPPGRHIRRAGLDFREGDLRLSAGRRLTLRDLALAAAMNHSKVPVHRRPRVAVLSTGDELVPVGTTPGPAQVVSSNGMTLTAMASAEGAEARDFGIVPDRLEATANAIRAARAWDADILMTTGGASVGDYDVVQDALRAEGLDLSFWKVALRPGKPLMHGRLGAMRVIGVPGNPVSSFVCAFLFMVPLVRALAGRTDVQRETATARLGRDLPANDERQDYLRATLERTADGTPVATPLSVQDSSMMSALARADCLVIRPPRAPAAKAGETCVILPLGV